MGSILEAASCEEVRVMRFKVIIEETVAQEFEVEAACREEVLAEAKAKYRAGEFVVCPGEVQARRMAVCEPMSDAAEWLEI